MKQYYKTHSQYPDYYKTHSQYPDRWAHVYMDVKYGAVLELVELGFLAQKSKHFCCCVKQYAWTESFYAYIYCEKCTSKGILPIPLTELI